MNKRKVATVLIPNKNGDGTILMVSRKNDHTDFGLVGGKMDKCDNDDILETCIRECFEESGIVINKDSLILLYQGDDGVMNNKYDCYCYLATDYSSEIDNTLEDGLVQWGDPKLVKEGSFGHYNTIVWDIYQQILDGELVIGRSNRLVSRISNVSNVTITSNFSTSIHFSSLTYFPIDTYVKIKVDGNKYYFKVDFIRIVDGSSKRLSYRALEVLPHGGTTIHNSKLDPREIYGKKVTIVSDNNSKV